MPATSTERDGRRERPDGRRRPPPVASYRFQLTPEFGFDDARRLLADLGRLGVSHLYLSPITEAVPGSTHGYDVVDHTRVRAEFGGREGLERLLDGAAEHGVGVLVDHVPNHVSVAEAHLNRPWWNTLRDGADSSSAAWFDIDWEGGDGRVIVPKLGSPLDQALLDGSLSIVGGTEVHYGPLRFPLAPGTGDGDLADVLARQHYELTWWQDPRRNVRRFFTIDDLVAVRVEDEQIASTVDTVPASLLDHPAFAGVRVDHVDGLADPGDYLRRLRRRIGDRLVFVEKILAPDEALPASWPVDGTTGYEHITVAEHTLLDPAAERPLMTAWQELTSSPSFAALEHDARREVLDGGLRPDLERLVGEVRAVDAELAVDDGRAATVALSLALDRYRTYLPADPASSSIFDRVVADAVAGAAGEIPAAVIERVARTIRSVPELLVRWQQLTGPVMAKGAEDRAFYRWFPLASSCEVGGRPDEFSLPVAAFHAHQVAQQDRSPLGMLAGTTHDTKRSEGVRARSLALAARADEWVDAARAWIADHDDLTAELDLGLVWLALQTAVTARPLSQQRLHDYLVKAAREGDIVSSWTAPDEAVERRLGELAGVLVDDDRNGPVGTIGPLVEVDGAAIGLRQLALQMTCPGFPDLYQGAPFEQLGLVDPDNRIPPDWDRWSATIRRAANVTPGIAGNGDPDRTDVIRTSFTIRVLALRSRHPAAFGADAGYRELPVTGPDAVHVIAFARTTGETAVAVTVVTRALGRPLATDTTAVDLPAGAWRSIADNDGAVAEGGPTALAAILGPSGSVVLERIDTAV